MEDMDIHTMAKVMATVILYLMGMWDMDTVMETKATVMSPNMDMIMGIHTEDMAIRMTIPTATMTNHTHRGKAPASRYYKEFFFTLLRTHWAVSESSYQPS